MLTIVAENSTLGDIMNAVKARTGATVDAPGGLTERVATRLGPAPPREVLADLLKGSHYDYVMMASDTDPQGVRNIILTRNSSASAGGATGAAAADSSTPQSGGGGGGGVNTMLRRMRRGPAAMNPAASQPAEEAPIPDAEIEQPEENSSPVQVVPPPHIQGQGPSINPNGALPPDMNQPGQPGQGEQKVRTPEELLQELQRMQQQRQEQQQQQQNQNDDQ
jgi:hypothetical protein